LALALVRLAQRGLGRRARASCWPAVRSIEAADEASY
jgi:hypothetical protein